MEEALASQAYIYPGLASRFDFLDPALSVICFQEEKPLVDNEGSGVLTKSRRHIVDTEAGCHDSCRKVFGGRTKIITYIGTYVGYLVHFK